MSAATGYQWPVDTEHVIEVYSDIIAQRDRSGSPRMRDLFDVIATRLRVIWQIETGLDTLHLFAFDEYWLASK